MGVPFSLVREINRYILTLNGIDMYAELLDPIPFTGDFEIEIELASNTIAGDVGVFGRLATTVDYFQVRRGGLDQLWFETSDGSVSHITSEHLGGEANTITLYREGLTIGIKLNGAVVADNTLASASSIRVDILGALGSAGNPAQFFAGEILSARFTDKSGAEDVVTNYVLDSGSTVYQQARGHSLGADILDNGNFATNDLTSWDDDSTGTGTADASSGACVLTSTDGSNAGKISQVSPVTAGDVYALGVTVSGGAQSVFIGDFLGASLGNIANGTHTFFGTAVSSDLVIQVEGDSGTATVDDVSVSAAPNTLKYHSVSASDWEKFILNITTNCWEADIHADICYP